MLLLSMLIACGGGDKNDSDSSVYGTGQTQGVTINFAGMVGESDFSCAAPYEGVGATATTFTPLDFRLYVHDVALLDSSGAAVPLSLTQDGMWQYESVALLDFEDKTGTCSNGTSEVNAMVSGAVPEGDYSGLQFTLGVPFALNHGDVSTAPSPLNLSTMFWNWESGYKFVRIDAITTGQPSGVVFHLGSTGCASDSDGNVTGCSEENLATITLSGFDWQADTVAVDIAGLYAGVDLDTNTGGMAFCMAGQDDPDCGPIFANLGLDFGDTVGDPAAQTFFRVK